MQSPCITARWAEGAFRLPLVVRWPGTFRFRVARDLFPVRSALRELRMWLGEHTELKKAGWHFAGMTDLILCLLPGEHRRWPPGYPLSSLDPIAGKGSKVATQRRSLGGRDEKSRRKRIVGAVVCSNPRACARRNASATGDFLCRRRRRQLLDSRPVR